MKKLVVVKSLRILLIKERKNVKKNNFIIWNLSIFKLFNIYMDFNSIWN